jgi:hypothetical protein
VVGGGFNMDKYRLRLSNGRSAEVTASSPLRAKHKYYSSSSHIRSEAMVESVKKVSGKPKSKRSGGRGFNPMDLLGF